MMADRRTLEILLKTLADSGGVDKIKSDLGSLKGEAQQTGQAFNVIGTAIGFSLGTAAAGTVAKFIDYVRTLVENNHKLADEIQKGSQQLQLQEIQWAGLARTAGRFFDVVKVGMSVLPTINKLAEEAAAAQAKELDLATNVFDRLGAGLIGQGPAANQLLQERTQKLSLLAHALKDFTDFTNQSKQSLDEWQRIQSGPVADAITAVDSKLADLTAKIGGVGNPLSKLMDPVAAAQAANKIAELGREYAVWSDRREKLIQQQGKETQGETESAAARRANLLLFREQTTLLQNIHEQEQLIRESPFLGADEKQAALLALYQREMQALHSEITALKAAAQNSALDPAQLELVNQKFNRTVAQAELLRLRVAGIKAPFAAELTNWASSFGTSAHQAAGALTNTLGTAINSTSQALAGLIFRTGNWRQTMSQAAQSIVADLIRIALQYVIARTIMFVVNKAFGSQESGVANAQAQGAFAAWEPAAIAASTASYGVAAGVGLTAFLAAVASGMVAGVAAGAAGGATTLHEGGNVRRRRMHSGGLAPDEVPIIAQEGEFMIQRSIAQAPGMMDFLSALNAGTYHEGGGVYDDWGKRIWGATPSWFTPPGGQGPAATPWTGGLDPSIEPTPIPVSTPSGQPSITIGPGNWGPTSSHVPRWAQFGGDPGGQSLQPGFPGTYLSGFGTSPSFGASLFGPTMLPTYWVSYPGVGNVPMAVPLSGWNPPQNWGTPPTLTTHKGGHIGKFHFGGSIARMPRFHGGGSLGGGAGAVRSGSNQTHVYVLMDRKQLVKEMATKQGHKIIYDAISGRRIDLGI